MSEITILQDQNKLFKFFQHLRITTSLEINQRNLNNNQYEKLEKFDWDNIKSFGKNIVSGVNRSIGNYEKLQDEITNQLETFKEQNVSIIDLETAFNLVNEIYKDGDVDLNKLAFASTIIFDDEYDYKYFDDGLKAVSLVLYGKEMELSYIRKKLSDNYNAIAPTNLSNLQKGVLLGIATSCLISVTALPLLLVSSSITGSVAASTIAKMGLGSTVVSVESLLLGAAITSASYGVMKLYNLAEVRKEFNSLSTDKNAYYLAFQCTYIELLKDYVSSNELKERLDPLLKNLSILKSDLDYFLFIENENTKNNLDKITSFHNFDKHLFKVLGLNGK